MYIRNQNSRDNNSQWGERNEYDYRPYERDTRFHPGINPQRSMNFEAYAAEGNRFIKEVAYELGVDRNRAARITRSVLHAIRDRISPDDAIQFAQGLPMALKGIFIDQYDISITPIAIRNPNDFTDFIFSKDGKAAHSDFPTRDHVIDALKGVFNILEKNMEYGQVQQIKHMFNMEILELID
jgi:uncharacterized protein (DUF2267 family)